MEAAREEVAAATAQRLEAWLLLPDADRAELLGGRIVYKEASTFERGDVVIGISGQIGRFRGPRGGGRGGWWLSQEVDLYLSGQGVRPDLVGWRVEAHPTPPRKINVGSRHLGVYATAPDWVCEVLSGSTRTRDEEDGIKWRAYWEAGVGHYWLVDLTRNRLTVYRRGKRDYEPVDVAGRAARKVLAPFDEVEFEARRVFMLADVAREP
jgi:hypothetical protein